MTRKDYELIAAVFAANVKRLPASPGFDGARGATKVLAEDLADSLRGDNPRFDTARFLKACGV